MSQGALETSHAVSHRMLTENGRRRSARVVLRVPLRLSARMPSGQRIHVAAESLVVNAPGGLLDVGMEMAPGQRILLNNLKSAEYVTGTALRVESVDQGRFSVAFEFEFAPPNFWPVRFPPANWSHVQ